MIWLWRLYMRIGYEHKRCYSCDRWNMEWEHYSDGVYYCSICGPLIRKAKYGK